MLALEQIQQLSGPVAQQLLSSHRLKPKVAEGLEERRKAIQGAVSQTSSDQMLLSVSYVHFAYSVKLLSYPSMRLCEHHCLMISADISWAVFDSELLFS